MKTDAADALREKVRSHYAAAATAVSGRPAPAPAESRSHPADAAESPDPAGAAGCCAPLYSPAERAELPEPAIAASLGCGNPLLVADLHAGERVLDLGSGGGIDVLLSARRVGPTGRAYGLDMTDEMLELARRNAVEAGANNVEFIKGTMEDIPLPDGSIDVIISNCVVNLSVDKAAVFAQMQRVLRPGGRIGISDVVADDDLTPAQRAERGGWVGCIAGALSRAEYTAGLSAAGFTQIEVTYTTDAVPGMHAAIIRATRR